MKNWKRIIGFLMLMAVSFAAGSVMNGGIFNVAVPTEADVIDTKEMVFDGYKSALKDTNDCYLCGDSDQSLMSYYRKFDTIGIISLNDWFILDFNLKNYDEEGNVQKENTDSGMWFGNTDEIAYDSQGIPSRGMASIRVTLKEKKTKPDMKKLQNNLCQDCLDKVCESLTYYGTEETAVPLAVIDFDTLDIYPLQRHTAGYFVRDYWLDIDFEEKSVEVKAYYLPEHRL